MKVKYQLFFSTILVVSLGFFAGGAFLLLGNFQRSLRGRVEQARLEHHTMSYFCQLRLGGEISGNDPFSDQAIIRAAAGTADELSWSGLSLCVSREKGQDIVHLYSDLPEDIGRRAVLSTIGEGPLGMLHRRGNLYDLLLTTSITRGETTLYFTTAQDITPVYRELASQTRSLLLIWAGMLPLLGGASLAVAKKLSRRLESLEETARRIAGGAYGERAGIPGEDEIARLGRSFDRMADSVEEKMAELRDYAKSRDDFARNFSHEMKTPMTSIIGYADLLRSQSCGEETVREAAGYIFREGRRLEDLSRRLLELMKLRQTRLELRLHPLGPILTQLSETARPLCEAAGVTLTVPACEGSAAFDPPLLLTLLTNLVNNARAACEAGGLVEVLLEERPDRWRITVQDDGWGIPAEEIPRLTEEFYRVDKARSGGGTGLGLAICREIARLHGGELSIASAPGAGTTVSFSLEKEAAL